jgi:Ser/Thr protein kinase RdoA (MazF antagonist)
MVRTGEARFAGWLEESILPRREALLALPRTVLHGDVNFENILMRGASPVLIDFEFTRVDARLFDLAGLSAPKRSSDGDFLLAPSAFTDGLLSAYGVTAEERELFPAIAVFHFLFIALDLSKYRPEKLPLAFEASRKLFVALPSSG